MSARRFSAGHSNLVAKVSSADEKNTRASNTMPRALTNLSPLLISIGTIMSREKAKRKASEKNHHLSPITLSFYLPLLIGLVKKKLVGWQIHATNDKLSGCEYIWYFVAHTHNAADQRFMGEFSSNTHMRRQSIFLVAFDLNLRDRRPMQISRCLVGTENSDPELKQVEI